jgi:hypothetical protein
MRLPYSQHELAGECSVRTLSGLLHQRGPVSPAAHPEPSIQLDGITSLALEVEGLR